MKTLLALTLASLASSSLLLVGCSSETKGDEPPPIETVKSSLARNTTPTLSAPELAAFESGEAAFALDLYKKTIALPDSADKDVLLSPHSVSTALAMTYAGSKGETKAEMKKALHFDLDDDRLHTAFNYLDLALESRGKGQPGKDGKPFRLKVTNTLWGQKGVTFQSPFLDRLAVDYGAGMNVLDFGQNVAAANTINRWVEFQTEDRIKDLVPADVLSSLTRLVLVNAVYFNAGWQTKFTEGATTPAPFTKTDGSTIDVDMMHGGGKLPYFSGDGFEAVELPYEGNEVSMLVIAPTKGSFATFESSLTGAGVLDILAGLQTKAVDLSFPKHKVESSFSLVKPLKALGMERAFGAADFTGIIADADLAITEILHKTFAAVDENGTEAAAATAVIVNETSAQPGDPVKMTVDRPFFTAIVDKQTKTILFFGRVLQPKS